MGGNYLRKKYLVIQIIFILIFSSTLSTVWGYDSKIQEQDLNINCIDNKNITESYNAYLLCIGRINNLSFNETSYSFNCDNVRIIFHYTYNESSAYAYYHHKKSNTIGTYLWKKSWGFNFRHNYKMDFYRFSIDNCDFRGILKPSYIIGIFTISIHNNYSFCKDISLKNDIKMFDLISPAEQSSYISFNLFIGFISDLETGEEYYSFNATNIFRINYFKFHNISWEVGINRYRDTKYQFYFGGIPFKGIIRKRFICGYFFTSH